MKNVVIIYEKYHLYISPAAFNSIDDCCCLVYTFLIFIFRY